jgi:hypothetical protein
MTLHKERYYFMGGDMEVIALVTRIVVKTYMNSVDLGEAPAVGYCEHSD